MIKPKKIFTFNHNHKQLEILVSLTFLGVFAANILSPMLAAYILYDVIPHFEIYIWLLFHFFIFLGRVSMAKNLQHVLKINSKKSIKYLKIIFTLSTLTTLLYTLAILSSLFYEASSLQIFTVSIIVVSLSAGALATLISVYQLFALYVVLSMIPLILMLLYHGGEMFYLFAFILSIFTLATLYAGHRQHLALKNSISLKETFKTIYEKSSDGIILIQNNRFKDCNEAIVKMFKYNSKRELFNTHLTNLMPEKQPDNTLSIHKMLKMTRITMKKGTNKFEWVQRRKNGELFWVEIVLTKIYLDDKELIHGTWRDINDRKKLEEERKKTNKKIEELNLNLASRVKLEVDKNRKKDQVMLHQSRLAQMGEMISMIAHQWRQPLAAISATSTTIELRARNNKLDTIYIQQKAQDISNYAQHLSRTIDDFRDFFNPNKEKTKTTYNEIIHSVLRIMDTSLKNKNIHLIQNLTCHEPLYTYPSEIRQVILNLITNAQEALSETRVENPYIKIETYLKKEQFILEVSDNAGGIPEENINHIFNPYFSTKKDKGGTGLGLYMSKIIIEEHCGGLLSVTNINSGSLFSIVLNKTPDEKKYHD